MADWALVTGGAQGIGRAACQRLAADGCQIMLIDRVPPDDPDLGEFIQADMSDVSATAKALDQALDGRVVTRLLNNVGMVRPALLDDSTLEDFDAVMALNVRSAIQCTKRVVVGMRERGFGRIVNVASRAVLGKARRTNYGASKAALIGMTRTWSLELAPHGITVNAICPGPTATELYLKANPPESAATKASLSGIPVGRIGTPEDMAHTISFFMSEGAGFVTGQSLFVCGGSSLGSRESDAG